MGHSPSDERTIKTVARINYLQSLWPNILNSEYPYVLSVFDPNPIKWINKYEWRTITDTENCALSTHSKNIGTRMNIKYDELARFEVGWKNNMEWYEDLLEWTENYEWKYMVPAETNRLPGDQTMALILWHVPGGLKPFGEEILSVLLEQRFLTAMSYDTPSAFYRALVSVVFTARRLILRYLLPPRPKILRRRLISEHPDPVTGRHYYQDYQAHPFYVKPNFWNRWGPEALLLKLFGGLVPGDHGDAYSPEGYLYEEVGPVRFKGKGLEMTKLFEEQIKAAEGRIGCPFG